MLVGVALDKVAVPPLMDKEKSLVSISPLPTLVLYIIPMRVCGRYQAFNARKTDEIKGTDISVNVAVLLHWVVRAW